MATGPGQSHAMPGYLSAYISTDHRASISQWLALCRYQAYSYGDEDGRHLCEEALEAGVQVLPPFIKVPFKKIRHSLISLEFAIISLRHSFWGSNHCSLTYNDFIGHKV